MSRYLHALWTNRFSVLLLALLVLGAGAAVLPRLSETIFPDVAFPKVVVLVTDGQQPVKLMLLQVTRPLELAAQGEPGVRLVRSQTGNGLSKLHVYFTGRVNPELAYLLLQARLAHVALPPGAEMTVRLQTPEVYPFAEYALVSNTLNSAQMQSTFAFQVRPALIEVPGVYTVTGTGRGWPEVNINLSPRRLAQHRLSAEQVMNALRATQGPYFSGVLHAYHQQFIVSTTPRPSNPVDLASLTLPLGAKGPNARRLPIPLDALGSVHVGSPPLLVEAAVNGWRHALIINIAPQIGVNQVALGRSVRRRIATLQTRLPAHMHLVPIYDLSGLIARSLHDVWVALVLGSIIAWLVVVLFLRRIGAALATLLVVPLAIAATLLVMRLFGLGLNVMTLGGLTAAIGALVDHAIVVMERGLDVHGSNPRERRRQAVSAVGHLLVPMTLATLTASLVFLPLILLSGTIGLLFRQMALTIVVALVTSQLVALAVTPVFAIWLAGKRKYSSSHDTASRLRRWYVHHLVGSMRRPWLAVPVILILAAIGVVALRSLPTAFLPPWDEGVVAVPYRTPVGSTVAETLRVGRELMRIAQQDPAVARTSVVIGRSFANPRSTPNKGALTIVLKRHRLVSTTAVMTRLHKAFRAADPALVALSQAQVMVNRLGDLSGSHAPLEVFLFGASQTALHNAGARLAMAFRQSGKFGSVVFKSLSAGPELKLHPRPDLGLYGLTPSDLARRLRLRLWGERAGFLLRGQQVLPIRVRLGGAPLTPGRISTVPVPLPAANTQAESTTAPEVYAPVDALARVALQGVVPFATHQALIPDAYLWLRPRGGEGLSEAASTARRLIARTHLPGGMTVVLGGYYAQQKQSFRQMAMVLAATLLTLLVLFGFQFGSQAKALAAMTSIAVAAPGAVAALVVARLDLDSTAFLGVLLVFAIAVNNVILIFSVRAHPGTRHGPAQAALAARTRVRPILMTMLADVGGFLPLAIGTGRGTELLQPMAMAVMGGLALAMVSSLWLAPVIYAGLYRLVGPDDADDLPVVRRRSHDQVIPKA